MLCVEASGAVQVLKEPMSVFKP